MQFYNNLEKMMEHLSKTGGFLTVKDENGKVNTMTISWGFVGFIWNKPHFITVVRPQRYTRDFLKTADSFTISVPFGSMNEELKICGVESGRDIDKSKVVTFKDAKEVSSPIVANCDFYYECKINYTDTLHTNKIPPEYQTAFYKDDYHDFFMGEIISTYQ